MGDRVGAVAVGDVDPVGSGVGSGPNCKLAKVLRSESAGDTDDNMEGSEVGGSAA